MKKGFFVVLLVVLVVIHNSSISFLFKEKNNKGRINK